MFEQDLDKWILDHDERYYCDCGRSLDEDMHQCYECYKADNSERD